MIKLLRYIFEPILEAFALDKALTDAPCMDISCGKLNDYEDMEDDGI